MDDRQADPLVGIAARPERPSGEVPSVSSAAIEVGTDIAHRLGPRAARGNKTMITITQSGS